MSVATLPRSARRRQARATRIVYRRPWVYDKQAEFLFTPKRYSIVEATTKSGKTHGCIVWLNEKAALGGKLGWNGWWVAPIRAQAKIAYDRFKIFMRKYLALFVFNDSELSILYPNGAKLWFKSADNPNSLYGDDVYAAVFDEATRAKEPAWHALYSTLTFTEGHVRIIGNVRGRKNWAFQLARRAEAGDPEMYHCKLTAWDAVEAGILSRATVESARRMLPEAVFNELYLAIPTEDGANPFNLAAIRKCLMPALDAGPSAAIGVDLAKSVDWTVKVGLNRAGRMSALDRYQKSWETTTDDLRTFIGSTKAMVDSTGVGDPIVERLQKGRSNVTGFKFTSPSKQMLMEGLAAAISAGADNGAPWIYAGPGNVMLNELEAFEFVYTRTGVRYAAPEGMHDDCVMALALAKEQHRQLGKVATERGRIVTL